MAQSEDYIVSKQNRRTPGAARQPAKNSTNGIQRENMSEFTQVELSDEQILTRNEPKVVLMLDQEGTIILIEGSQPDLFGLKRYEMVGNSVHNSDTNKLSIIKTISDAIQNGTKAVLFTYNNSLFQIFIIPIWRGNREISGQLVTISEMPGKMDLKKMVSSRNSLYRSLFDNSLNAIAVMDSDGKVVNINKAFEELFQYPFQEIKGKRLIDFIVPANLVEESSDITFIVDHGETAELETFRKRKDGKKIDVSVTASRILSDNNEPYYFQIFCDISNRKKQEELFTASLLEKELLLKEVNHRVKKCIQIISSLLGLKAKYLREERASDVISEIQNRIKSLALIHENLYHTANLSRIDFDRYVRSLITYLTKTLEARTDKIKILVEAENIFLNTDTAIPCGLIINELVTNSLKHAFPNNREGEIHIELIYHNNNKLTLTVRDNGIGIKNNDDKDTGNTVGLQIVKNLVKQLEGKMSLKNSIGTECKITFSIVEDSEK